jgi:hypothetical protein
MHVDAESDTDLGSEAAVSPNLKMTMKAAVWRGSNDDEAVASAMDQFDHLGQVWLMFPRGEDPAMATRFRARAMHDIMLHWPGTLSLSRIIQDDRLAAIKMTRDHAASGSCR